MRYNDFMFEVRVETQFSSAHHLLNYKGKCENQHGHNWIVEVCVTGEELDKSNILVDFKVLKKEVNEIVDYLDHKDINELPEFKGIFSLYLFLFLWNCSIIYDMEEK